MWGQQFWCCLMLLLRALVPFAFNEVAMWLLAKTVSETVSEHFSHELGKEGSRGMPLKQELL